MSLAGPSAVLDVDALLTSSGCQEVTVTVLAEKRLEVCLAGQYRAEQGRTGQPVAGGFSAVSVLCRKESQVGEQ